MRFKQFLMEEDNPSPNEDDDFDLEKFLKDTKFYAEQFKGNPVLPMWHGSYDAPGSWDLLTFRERRKPKDTIKKVHNAVNEYFTKQFKFPFRNGVFATGRRATANLYGHPCLIIPSGPFEWLSSPNINDMTEVSNHYENDPGEVVRELNEVNWYHNENLVEAIKSHNEIMIKCSEFYLIKDNALWLLDKMGGK